MKFMLNTYNYLYFYSFLYNLSCYFCCCVSQSIIEIHTLIFNLLKNKKYVDLDFK
jgi:hypothetical protein